MRNKNTPKKDTKDLHWELFEKFFYANCIAYRIVDKFNVNNYPVIIGMQSEKNYIAYLIIPTFNGHFMSTDLTQSNEWLGNKLVELMIEAKKKISIEKYDIPLLVNLVRIGSANKKNERALVLNKTWVF